MTKKNKSRVSILILTILTLSSLWITPLAVAMEPPVVPGGGEYFTDEGVLDSDTYILYPWEKESLTVGFSKYGEMIDDNMGVGLKYNDMDVFASNMIDKTDWFSGWVMDIHYTQGGYLKNTWAYALYSDRTNEGVAGDWRTKQMTKDANDPGDTNGGRRTNGYAESEPIRLIYDGPRKAIYLLKTTIYDKEEDSTPLVELTIQLVFNKVKKYVMEIKDIKRIDNSKMDGPFQIEFSQRAEWDLGVSTAPRSFAEFYNGLETKYDKHPFYYPEGGVPATYDLAQIISAPDDPEEDRLVGFAAFWPPLISKWVTETYNVKRLSMEANVPSLLTSMETYEHYSELPTSADDLVDPWIIYDETMGEIIILLPKEPVPYPRGEGEWTDIPWVFKKDGTGGYAKLLEMTPSIPGQWIWEPTGGPYGAVRIKPFEWTWGDEFLVLYKRTMMGHRMQRSTALESMEPMFEAGEVVTSYGMVEEPDTPYVFAEWDFDLDYDHPYNSTQQFRCVSVYGVTDYVNAVDPDMPEGDGAGEFRIESEVLYQLDEVFNPIDLVDAAHKNTFRWVQKGTIGEIVPLTAHLYDKYGNEWPVMADAHDLVLPEKWGYYCRDSEKILVMDSTGQLPSMLLARSMYTIMDLDVTFDLNEIIGYDLYKILYTTTPTRRVIEAGWHTGRWEWMVIGEFAKPSDSLGASMITAALGDWKNVQVWLSGLDFSSELGPSIPWTMREFNEPVDTAKDGYYHDYPDDMRASFRDDWSTPDDWVGETINPYAVSSGDLVVVGGPIANLGAEYFNDFTDALIFTEYGDGFYAPGCWARTVLDHYQGKTFVDGPDDELWYNSNNVDDDVGHAIISVYKDLNETTGMVVYGYTAEDTYYASYAFRGGLLAWLQEIQPGTTTILLEIDYSDLHPVRFHVVESLGPFTECTGFGTNFKTSRYYRTLNNARDTVEAEAASLGISYKLVEIEWCAQVHPDP